MATLGSVVMAAIEVPVQVAFSNEKSKICLEPEGSPMLNFVLSIQIPILDLVNSLAEFQSKYDAVQEGQIPIEKDPGGQKRRNIYEWDTAWAARSDIHDLTAAAAAAAHSMLWSSIENNQ